MLKRYRVEQVGAVDFVGKTHFQIVAQVHPDNVKTDRVRMLKQYRVEQVWGQHVVRCNILRDRNTMFQ